MTVDEQFNRLHYKLQVLIKQLSGLQKENEQLKKELLSAKNSEAAAHQRVAEMQQQITILRVASGDMAEQDKKDFERRINSYLKEIDKCITFLSK